MDQLRWPAGARSDVRPVAAAAVAPPGRAGHPIARRAGRRLPTPNCCDWSMRNVDHDRLARTSGQAAARTRPHRRCPVDPDPDDTLGRLRARNAHQLRPILRALHEAADDPHVVGLVARRRRHAAVGGDAGAAAAVSRPSAEAEDRVGRELRRGVGRHDRVRARHRVRRDLAAARRRPGPARRRHRDDVPARRARQARHRTAARAALRVQERRRPDHAHRFHRGAPRGDRPAGRSRSSTTPSRRSPPAAALDGARVRELVDTGPRTAVEAREAGLVDQLGYRDQVYAAARERVGERGGAAVRRPVAPAAQAPSDAHAAQGPRRARRGARRDRRPVARAAA